MSKQSIALIFGLVFALLVVAGAFAAVHANGYSLERWTVDNGGGVSSAGGYSLAGTIGQPDASPVMTGGTYSLTGGYWAAMAAEHRVFLPLILRL